MKRRRRFTALLLVVLMLFVASLSTPMAAPHNAEVNVSETRVNEKVEVIVGFNGPVIRDLVENAGGEVEREFELVDAVVITIPVRAIDALAKNPNVRYIEENIAVQALDQTIPWGIDRVFGDESYSYDTWLHTAGNSFKVAVLDTGIDRDHEDLAGQVKGGTTTVDATPWYNDVSGHGTHVAGTIAALDNNLGVVGVAPDVHLYAVKVLDDDGGGSVASVVAGIEWAVQQNIPVMNMSLGSSQGSTTMEDAVNAAYEAGHLIIASAGNAGRVNGRGDTVGYPAQYESTVAVAASTRDDTRASFSSHGPAVEIIAPGQDILSTLPGDNYGSYNGTSMAAPHVAGVAALVWSTNPDLTNVQVREILNSTAEDLGLSSEHQGHGLVRADLAVQKSLGLDPQDPQDPQDPEEPQDPQQLTGSVNTDQTSYSLNSWVNIQVKAAVDGEAKAGVEVTGEIKNPSGEVFGTFAGTTNSDGVFEERERIRRGDSSGVYTVTATLKFESLEEAVTTSFEVR